MTLIREHTLPRPKEKMATPFSRPLTSLPCPPVSLELVEWLERLYPDRLPADHMYDPRELDRKVGQQNVIRYLRGIYNRQREHSLGAT